MHHTSDEAEAQGGGLSSVEGFRHLGAPAVVLERLGGGERSALGEDRFFYPASMIKTPLVAALACLVEKRERRLDDLKTVAPANMTANDAASPLVPGYKATLGELAELAITRSDNVATNELIDVVRRERVGELLGPYGLRATEVRRKLSGSDPLIDDPEASGRNTHPVQDAARLFAAIAERMIPGAAWLEDLLGRQEWNTKLSRGLRAGDRFAHKTGDTSEVSHDGGVLTTESGRRYVLVVYTALPSSDDADARIARYMKGLRPLLD